MQCNVKFETLGMCSTASQLSHPKLLLFSSFYCLLHSTLCPGNRTCLGVLIVSNILSVNTLIQSSTAFGINTHLPVLFSIYFAGDSHANTVMFQGHHCFVKRGFCAFFDDIVRLKNIFLRVQLENAYRNMLLHPTHRHVSS